MSAAGNGEFFHDAQGVRLILRRVDANTLELKWEGDRPTAYRRLMGRAPRSDELARYAGELVNDETGARLRMVVTDEQLWITTLAAWRIPLQAAGPDRFTAGPWVLEFVTGAGGTDVRGMRLHRERLWDLRFQKAVE